MKIKKWAVEKANGDIYSDVSGVPVFHTEQEARDFVNENYAIFHYVAVRIEIKIIK